ncbi:transcriptional regulator [Dyadobacter luteus]|jgi:Rrf2 family protein|uniref:Transcriptional regulator n=1 Tax=Dyadobacter luteus TaxID=2259619 RepID=A0A3D8YIH1_9BACT|nr:Rrf2 family transcriptional regulator [Dyadobacter luteus]REA63291.1 transcriptional regulator [Dyadobacter luteus]
MFSKTCEYAIRAMIYIAQQSKSGGKTGFKQIAHAIDAPEPFIAKILQQLGRENLVQSSKGPHGGFYINEQTMNRTLADVVKAIDGDKIFSGCGLGLTFCSEKNPCPIHNEFKSIRNQMQQMLQSATVSQFNDLLDRRLVHLGRN